ncbi:hypothetical protein Tco_0343174 [Tanacetum coccineum]
MPPPDFSTLTPIPNVSTSELPPVTTSVFAATTPENTPLAYHASTSANPNPMISPAFIEANYEILESFLRERRKQIRNEDLRTELEYFSEEGKSPPNGTHLSHYAQPFIPGNLHPSNGFIPAHVNSYSQPFTGIVNGQPLSYPPQAQNGNPSFGGTSAYHPQGGYVPHTFTNSNMPPYNGFVYSTTTPSNNYPFYAQPMYAQPNIPPYLNLNPMGLFTDPMGSVTPFFCWIEDYPLPNGLKMPSHIGSYDGKGDPFNYLHLFEGAIRMQKWVMPVACHMFTYTLIDSARIWWNSQKAAREVATNGTPNDRRESFERSNSWDNNRGQKSRDRFSPYQGANHGLLYNLSTSPREILATEKVAKTFEQPPSMFGNRRSRDMTKYYHFQEDHEHETNDCRQFRNQIEEAVKSGQLSHLVKRIKKERAKASDTQREDGKKDKGIVPVEAPIIIISQGEPYTKSNTSEE